MPSGGRKRKAKKKKQAGGAQELNQQHDHKEDSGNEQELEIEHEHEQEQDHGHEEDPITPKTPVQSNEGEEKEKGKVEGGSSDAEEVGFLDRGFNQNQENHSQTSLQEVKSTDSNLVVPENGGGGLQNEVEVLSGGALEDNDGPTGNLGPLMSTEEGHPKAAPVRTLSSSSSSSSSSLSVHVRDDGDEVHNEENETITDLGIIALDLHDVDENEVSSSKLGGPEDNESDQSLGPSTNVNETLPSPKGNNDTHVDMETPSEELESSDGDESKLDVVSTMATLDANESIQSVGSVDSPRSVYSQQYMDQTSNERAELASQGQDRGSEGFSETTFQELGSKVDFLNAESGEKDVYKVQIEDIEFPQEEDCHHNSLSEESLKSLMNEENIKVPTEIVNDNSLSEESLKDLRNEENIQVPTEIVSDNYAIVMEELTQVAADLEKPQVASSVSLAAAIEEREAIPKVNEDDAKESVMPLSKSESVNTRHISAVSTSGEAGEKVVSTGEAIADATSTTGQANQDVVSAGGAGKDDIGLIKVQGTSADPNEISDKEIASHPRNGTNEKKIILPQRESRTSWLNCCGIIDLFTAGRN